MPALPSLRQLKYLVALAELRSFTRAAAACHVTQSTLSAGLQELEGGLGVRLVERNRRQVVITPLGAEVAERARAILAQAEDLVELAAGAAEPLTGTVRLGVIPTIAPFLLPRLLPALRAAYPRLRLLLREALTEDCLARLRAAHLDLALIALPYDTGELQVQPLFDDEFWLAGRPDDPVFRDARLTVGPSVAGRLLLLEEGHCLREHTLAACKRGASPAALGIEATSLLTLVQMAEAGTGLALVPEIALKGGLLERTSLVARPLAPPVPKRVLALAARRTSARRGDLERLGEFVRAAHAREARASLTSRGRRAGRPR